MFDLFKRNVKSIRNDSFPTIISIIGPKKVGKTTFNKSIASYFLHNFNEYLYGPLVIVVEQNISYLFIESPPDILSISNLTKASDIIVLAIDCYFGLELEIFEFSSFFNSHGCPRILAIFTHIDLFSSWKNLKKAKKRSKIRLKKEIGNSIKIFYLTGITLKELYFPREISNITRFFSGLIVRTTSLQKSIPFVVITRLDLDLKKSRKKIILSGFQKGKDLNKTTLINSFIPGLGEIKLKKLKKYINKKRKNFEFIEKKTISFYQKLKKNFVKVRMFNFMIIFKNKNITKKKKVVQQANKPFASNNFKNCTKFFIKKTAILKLNKKKSIQYDTTFSKFSDLYLKKLKNRLPLKQIKSIEIVLDELSYQFSRYFDPTFPLILCIDPYKRSQLNFTKAIVNRHKWNKQIIWSQDIIFLSIGWKFLSTSIFFFNEKDKKKAYMQKFLSFNNSSSVCFVTSFEFPGTGIVGLLNPGNNYYSLHRGTLFNIIFTGSITEVKNNFKIFKKIKIKGEIYRSFKKTCYVKNMFSNEIEIMKFLGSFIYDNFGKKGVLKKSIKNGPPGSFRALFEKKKKKGEKVFLKLLVPIKLTKKIEEINFFSVPNDFKEIKFIKKK